jgi:tetratricopeptide (TPR) repeat protein
MSSAWRYLSRDGTTKRSPRGSVQSNCLKKAKAMESPAFVTAYLAFAYGAAGDRAAAMAEMAELPKKARNGSVLPFNLALVYLGLGDHARTLDNLERALAADSQLMPWIGRDAIFDSIRSEPRFAALLNKMGMNRRLAKDFKPTVN